MKNFTLALAMLLMTAVSAGQTSRRISQQDNHGYYASSREFRGGREVAFHYPSPPASREYRRTHTPFRIPENFTFYWTPEVRYEYFNFYPVIGFHKYPIGFRIENVSAYDAINYRGEIVNVYGKVFEIYYSKYTDEYILYFGAYFPYHDFTAVIPGEIARKYTPWPERYFSKEHLVITGLVTVYEGVPEIAIKANRQIRLY